MNAKCCTCHQLMQLMQLTNLMGPSRPSGHGESLRYSSWSATELAKKVEDGKATLEEIEAYALKTSEPKTSSGKQDSA